MKKPSLAIPESLRGEKGCVRSMTGFAAERVQTGLGDLTVSLRSVNHRGLDLHFHGNHEFAIFENEVRSLLKQSIARGHVEVRFALGRLQSEGPVSINREVLARYVAVFRQTSSEYGLDALPDLNVLFTLRGVLDESQAADLPADFEPELLAAVGACAKALNRRREREGDQLRDEMMKQAQEIEHLTGEIAATRTEALPHFGLRLREKLAELLTDASISESRLAEEAALLADRTDIEEEIVRLRVHTEELRKTLAQGGEVGKRLDFLLQEMNREINTALAKSANAGEPGLRITKLGLTVKANIERIREQALNLE